VTNGHPCFPLYTVRLQIRTNNPWQLFYTYIRVNIKGEPMKDKDLLKLLLKNGWKDVRQRGSHHRLKKDDQVEVIAVHGKDVPIGLLNAILKRTGLK
jgi:predicted RNA binding protein YcfA (HicA-like mRNA interferase family)